MLKDIKSALVLFVLLSILTGMIYPALVTGFTQSLFPHEAHGSLLQEGSRVLGSRLIGQHFSDPKHFWGRPSATAPMPYNSASSSGSNLGPLNPALELAVRGRIAALKASDPSQSEPIPVDLVTTSASGLDPQISVAAALWQAPRIARTQNIPEDSVRKLIASQTEGRQWGLFGEPRVNVLALNLALDKAASQR